MSYRTPVALEMAVKEAARRSEMDTGRAIENFYYHRFLCRVFSDPNSKFVLKGGRGVLARTTRARYSRDVDFVVNEASIEDAVAELARSASKDMDDFLVFDLLTSRSIRVEDDYREGVRLTFAVRMGIKDMQPLSVDLVLDRIPHEETETIVPADRFDVKGIRVFDYRVVPVPFALADKFCAILETHANHVSSRVKDLIDILVYLELGVIDIAMLASKLKHEAGMRGIELPARFAVPQSWFEQYSSVYGKLIREVALDAIYPTLKDGSDAAAKLYDASRKQMK